MQQDYLDQDYADERVENPSAFADLLESPLALTQASTGQRFANYLVDALCFYACSFGVGLILGIVAMLIDSPALLESLEGPFSTVLGFLVMLTYYFIMEATTGRTIGKLVTRTRVVMEDGSKPTTNAIAKRTLSRLIPFEAFTFFGDSPGLHDRLSKTRVVKMS